MIFEVFMVNTAGSLSAMDNGEHRGGTAAASRSNLVLNTHTVSDTLPEMPPLSPFPEALPLGLPAIRL